VYLWGGEDQLELVLWDCAPTSTPPRRVTLEVISSLDISFAVKILMKLDIIQEKCTMYDSMQTIYQFKQ
jgi:hypothetical protein